jgi:tripartite-type tricarboxylate transporter receptor subunit TctC
LFVKALPRTTLVARPLAAAALVAAVACAAPAADTDPAGIVRIVVGVSAGGGQDLYARVIAAHLGRHLPGTPTVVVENMPGAGGLVAAAHLSRRARPDGLTLGLLGAQVVMADLMGDAAAVDVRTMPVVGSPAGDDIACVFSRTSGFTLDRWRSGSVPRLGMTHRGSTTAAYALLIAAALDLKVHPIVGYGGTADIKAAVASREVDGLCLSRSSFVASFPPLDAYVAALRVGARREDDLAGAPDALAFARSDRARALLEVAATIARLARYVALPPGTPADRVASIRVAFDRTMADPAFVAALAAARLDLDPQSAASLETRISDLLNLAPDTRRDVIAVLGS